MGGLVFRPVTKRTKNDFVPLFDRPGWQKQCWCMVWRATSEEGSGASGAVRRRQMLGRIDDGTPIGLLGYDDGEPVAWVSIAPKDTYRRLGGPEPADGEKVWSLACMFVRRDYRGKGLAHELIAAAVKQAKKRGATMVEAYPVDPESPSYGYMGFVPAFQRAGFVEIGMAGSRRHVMLLLL
ncbi:MAG TPA: GNAT family N-acetyltransferase [Geminicoccaceae bacterium]|nr:GNAT family N-acetyltransferase [Geminicoccaceae bacterium]